MRTCPSCGGIVGRDCFNPIECAAISESQAQQHDKNHWQEGYTQGYHEGQKEAMRSRPLPSASFPLTNPDGSIIMGVDENTPLLEVKGDEKLNRLVKLVSELVYYSQIHTVKGVRPAEMQTHEESWREAQQWLWKNCKIVDGEYHLAPTPSHKEGYWKKQCEAAEKVLRQSAFDDMNPLGDFAEYEFAYDEWKSLKNTQQ